MTWSEHQELVLNQDAGRLPRRRAGNRPLRDQYSKGADSSSCWFRRQQRRPAAPATSRRRSLINGLIGGIKVMRQSAPHSKRSHRSPLFRGLQPSFNVLYMTRGVGQAEFRWWPNREHQAPPGLSLQTRQRQVAPRQGTCWCALRDPRKCWANG